MIEINWTFFVQLANFLVLIFLLNRFLFKPILENVERREARLKEFTLDAERLGRRTEELVEEYSGNLEEAKKRTSDTLHKAKQEASAEQVKIIQEARKEFSNQVEKAMVDIEQYAEKAEKELKKEAEAISAEITSKIMGKN
jgi:F-type H+-transporting ATPase subunit b